MDKVAVTMLVDAGGYAAGETVGVSPAQGKRMVERLKVARYAARLEPERGPGLALEPEPASPAPLEPEPTSQEPEPEPRRKGRGGAE